ncbi:hypothetical protein SAMN06265360_11012 [Haloechinothrix alba]|uniref:Zinc-finger n=1 Tax=Haloechinothrix alba TaxID=664784 RepID=A0A238X9K8_9PSEU|nr:hypothetical protein [Haloechinothrix alba]SNR55735.1 hypothetical protein SAMN06265360_11012 [Haloechinothrix alba]
MAEIRWQEACGALHAYWLRGPCPNRAGDTVAALGHTEPVTVTEADTAPRRHTLGPFPTCTACDIAARLYVGAPLWGYTREEIDSVLPQLPARARARAYAPARRDPGAATPEATPTPSGAAAPHDEHPGEDARR